LNAIHHFPMRRELPGANPLKDAHAALDTAVHTTCGFNAKKDSLPPTPRPELTSRRELARS